LYDTRTDAVVRLQKEIDKRRKKLLETVEYDLPKPKKKAAKKK